MRISFTPPTPYRLCLSQALVEDSASQQIVSNVRISVGLHAYRHIHVCVSCAHARALCCCLSQGLARKWQTSQQRKGKQISISGTTVTKTNQSWGFGTAVVSDSVILQPGSRVKKRWSFTIKAGDQHTIGVVTEAYNAASHEYINKTNNGWGYYQGNGNKGHGGPANTAYGAAYKTGDVVDGL